MQRMSLPPTAQEEERKGKEEQERRGKEEQGRRGKEE